MNAKAKIFILGASLGVILFSATWYLYLRPSARKNEQPRVTDENIETAVTAYTMALQDNVAPSELAELNKTFAKDFGLKVYKREDEKIVVTNLSGREIKIV